VILLLVATDVSPLAWVLAPLLAIPTAGIYRLAALVVRDDPVSVWDAFTAWRQWGGRALLFGTMILALVLMFVTNLVIGLEARGVLGWSLATFAGWGLAGTVIFTLVVWPLLVDPWRSHLRVREVLRLGALLALAHPLRFGALAVLLLGIVALSTLGVVLVLTLAVALVALVDCRYVLPAADRFATRLSPPAGAVGGDLL
jgi:uncharacterized membrane protein YesL